MSLYSIISLLIPLSILFVSGIIYYRNSKSPINMSYSILLIIVFCWKFSDYMCLQSTDLKTAYFWMKAGSFKYLGYSVFFHLISFYTGSRKILKNRPLFVILYSVALFFIVTDITMPNVITTQPVRSTWGYTYSFVPHAMPVRIIFYIWSFGIFLGAAYLLGRYFFVYKDRKSRKRNIAFSLAFIGPVALYTVELLFIRRTEYQGYMSNVYFTWLMAVLTYSMLKYNLFQLSPETAAYTIVDTMKGGLLLLDPSGDGIFANPAFLDFTRIPPDKIFGKNLHTFMQSRDLDEKLVEKITNGEEIENHIYSLTRPDGENIYVSFSNFFLFDHIKQRAGIVCIVNDITELKHAQDELQKNRDFLEVTLSSIADAVIATDQDQRITFLNPMAENLTGCKREDAIGNELASIFRVIDERTRQVCDLSFAGSKINSPVINLPEQCLLLTKNDTEIPIDESGAPIKFRNGAIKGLVIVFRDVSEQRAAQKKLLNTENRLLYTEKMSAIGQLAAGVAHEVNNPMGYILSNLAVLKKYMNHLLTILNVVEENINSSQDENAPAEELKLLYETIIKKWDFDYIRKDLFELLDETAEGSERVKRIVIDLRNFCRPDQNEFSRVDINSEIENSLTLVWNELKYKCEVDKDFAQLPEVVCNRGRISQVFVNLLINASQAVDEKNGRISIRTYQRDPFIYIDFSDNGKGIPEEIIEKIFDPFFTTESTHTKAGLGLSLVYGIITNHNWTIDVKSEVGSGTTFTIRIPLKGASNE